MGSKQQNDLRKILNELKVSTDKGVTYKVLLKIRMNFISKSDDIQLFVEQGENFEFFYHLRI